MAFGDYISTVKTALKVAFGTTPRLLWKFIHNFAIRSMLNIKRFERRQEKGKPFYPAFIMISITERCNLSCGGCWVSQTGKKTLSIQQIEGVIKSSKENGSYFFGILGGEPLLYADLFDIFDRHKDCYFQLFTNGTLLTDEVAFRLRKVGNVTPVISIEGLEEESDARRGKEDVYNRSLAGVRACKKAKLIFGVAASICKSNYNDLVNREYLEMISKEGASYLWYYIYRPVGAIPNYENALDKEQIEDLRRFIVDQRRNAPLFIIDTYWDEKGNALCPGAIGMSHHISPSGAVEFCPPLQMAVDFINEDASNLTEIFNNSEFLANMRMVTSKLSRGCILMENPEVMVKFLEQYKALETTSRATVLDEFKRMNIVAGHNMEGREIPEKNKIYRFIKKHYFFGFGAYG